MTAGQSTRRMSSVSLAPAALVGLVGVTLVGGGLLGAAITSQFGSVDPSRLAIQASGQAAPPFDAVEFRAGERGILVAQPTSDAVEFRAGERGILVAQPTHISSSLVAPAGSAAANSPRTPPKAPPPSTR